jgi:hypothetical protein
MAICRYCKTKVSYQARSCPKCGCPNPGRVRGAAPITKDNLEVSLSQSLGALFFAVALYVGWNIEWVGTSGLIGVPICGTVGYFTGWVIGKVIVSKLDRKKEEIGINIISVFILGFIIWLFL